MLPAPAGCCAVLPSLFEFRPEQFHLPPFDDLINGQVSLRLPAVSWLPSTAQVQQLSTPSMGPARIPCSGYRFNPDTLL